MEEERGSRSYKQLLQEISQLQAIPTSLQNLSCHHLPCPLP